MNKRSGRPATARPLDGDPVEFSAGEDPREKLVDWMTASDNPYFARAIVNRYWAHFFGSGIVDPPDDMRLTNPPSNPELLDALARDFVKSGYRWKHLIRTICNSRTYQLSSEPNEFNRDDKRNYARYYPKRLSGEVLLDALATLTGSKVKFAELPQDRYAPNRATMLPDESFSSYFLDVFGRPQRNSACQCERVGEANLGQALHLLNSEEVQTLLADPQGRAAHYVADSRPEATKIDELFVLAVGKKPTDHQRALALANIAAHPDDKRVAYENIVWALINTKDFLFNK